MKAKWWIVMTGALLVGGLWFGGRSGIAQQNKPVVNEKIYTRFFAPPPSLAEMIVAADAVVHGRIVGSQPETSDIVGDAGPIGKNVRTRFRLKVIEILHSLGPRPVDLQEISILREGGDRDKGSHVERVVEEGFPHFVVGSEYVVFLKWNDAAGGWMPAFGPDSVFQLSNGRVDSPGKAKTSRAEKGNTTEAFLDTLRKYGR